MREGIFEQFPGALPKDKVVLVVGPEDYHGLNILKSLIQTMNRGDKWIRAEFRAEVSDSQVSDKVSVLLTMVGVKHGTLTNMRKAASQLSICCPHQALTVSEVKEALQILDRIRKGESGGMAYRVSQNGNSTHVTPNNGESQRLEQTSGAPQPQPVPEKPAIVETEIPAQPDSTNDVGSALKTLENFGASVTSVVEETQLAVLVISDQLKAVMTERNDLRKQLGESEQKIISLKNDLMNAHKIARENATIMQNNKELKDANVRLQATLDSLGELIRGAQK